MADAPISRSSLLRAARLACRLSALELVRLIARRSARRSAFTAQCTMPDDHPFRFLLDRAIDKERQMVREAELALRLHDVLHPHSEGESE